MNTGEACDDGNGDGGDGCDAACHVERCGDGTLSQGEGCDDGNSANGDGCFDCLPEICGNARIDPEEECDEGLATDACIDCERVRCGNFRMEPGEDCDGPREPACVACFIPTMEMGTWRLDLEARAPDWGNQPFPLLALDDDRFVAADGVQRIEGANIVLESVFPRSGPVSALRTGDALHLLECTPSGVRVDTNAALQLGRCDALAILDSDGDGAVEVWRAADGEVTGFDVVDDGNLIFVERSRQDVGAAAGSLTVVAATSTSFSSSTTRASSGSSAPISRGPASRPTRSSPSTSIATASRSSPGGPTTNFSSVASPGPHRSAISPSDAATSTSTAWTMFSWSRASASRSCFRLTDTPHRGRRFHLTALSPASLVAGWSWVARNITSAHSGRESATERAPSSPLAPKEDWSHVTRSRETCGHVGQSHIRVQNSLTPTTSRAAAAAAQGEKTASTEAT